MFSWKFPVGRLAYEVLMGNALSIFFFVTRLYLCYLFFGFLLRIFMWIFNVQRTWFFYSLILLDGFVFLFWRSPSLFDGLKHGTWLVHYLREFSILIPLSLAAMATVLFLVSSVWARRPRWRWAHGLALVGLLGLLGWMNDGSLPTSLPQVQGAKAVILAIDGLRWDTDLTAFGANESLRKFLTHSQVLPRVYNPLAGETGFFVSLFKGESPFRAGVRHSFSEEELRPDFYKSSWMKDAVGKNLRITLDSDGGESLGSRPSFLSEVRGPLGPTWLRSGFSIFFRDYFYYAFLEGTWGPLLLPEMHNAAAFPFAFRFQERGRSLQRGLREDFRHKGPSLSVLHESIFGWPGIWGNPARTERLFADTRTPYSYAEKLMAFSQKNDPEEWKLIAADNAEVYREGVRRLVQGILNPLFLSLDQAGVLDRGLVVLTSTYSENFWKKDRDLPVSKIVEHGSSLMFGGDSARLFFRVSGAGGSARAEGDQNLDEVLQNLGKSFFTGDTPSEPKRSGPVYVETDFWPHAFTRGQFESLPPTEWLSSLRWDRSTRAFYLPEAELPRLLQEKQRALFEYPYRYVLFPSFYGWKEFLCRENARGDCMMLSLSEKPELWRHFREAMSPYVERDVHAYGISREDCSLAPANRGGWELYFQSRSCLARWHDYATATRLMELAFARASSEILKTALNRWALVLCAEAGIYNGRTAPSFLKDYLRLQGEATVTNRVIGQRIYACWRELGNEAEAGKYKHLAGFLKGFSLGDPKVEDPTQNFQSFRHRERKLVRQRSDSLNLVELARYRIQLSGWEESQALRPQFRKFAQLLDLEKLSPEIYDQKAQQIFSEYFAYDLSSVVSKVYEMQWDYRQRRTGEMEAAFWLLEVLRDKTLAPLSELAFFDSLDEMTSAARAPSLASLRSAQVAALDRGPYRMREAEWALAAWRVTDQFCRAARSKSCEKMKARFRESTNYRRTESFFKTSGPKEAADFLASQIEALSRD